MDITYDAGYKFNSEVSDADLHVTLPSGTLVDVESIDAIYQVP